MKNKAIKISVTLIMVITFLFSAFIPLQSAFSENGGEEPTPTGEVSPTSEPSQDEPDDGSAPTILPGDDPIPGETPPPVIPGLEETALPTPPAVGSGETPDPGMPVVPIAASDPVDVSQLINITAIVAQDTNEDGEWIEINNWGTIDGTKPVRVTFSFNVPVKGDSLPDALAVHQGDYADFILSDAFSVFNDLYIPQYFDSTYMGTMSISSDGWNTVAHMTFDGEDIIFTPQGGRVVSGVNGWFYIDMYYNGHEGNDPWGGQIRTLMDQNFNVIVDTDETTYSITDLSTEPTADGNTHRTILVEAVQSVVVANNQVTRDGSLEGFSFVYDVETLGAFIEGTFKVEDVSPEPGAVFDGSTLNYTFPAGATSPATVSFDTEGYDDPGDPGKNLLFGLPFMPFAGPGNDVTDLLKDPEFVASVAQDLNLDGTWEEVADGGTIDGTKPVRVTINFNIPVEGDGLEDPYVVRKGDYADFPLSTAFTVHNAEAIPLLFDGIPVGTVTFVTDGGMTYAHVDFDGEDIIFTPEGGQAVGGVSAGFYADLEYNGHGGENPWGNQDVTLLERDFVVSIDTDETTYSVDKTATTLLSDQKIRWSVAIDATQTVTVAGITHTRQISLEGYDFVDDLSGVGEYVTGSFQVNGAAPDPTATFSGSVLNYTFAAGLDSPATVTFETKIPDGKFFASDTQTIPNTAELHLEDELVKEGSVNHTFTPPTWITKSGVASNEMINGVYDPTNRLITWTIEFNHGLNTLVGVQIRDSLSSGLAFVSAEWFKDNAGTWESVKTWATEPAGGVYDAITGSNPTGTIDYKGRLVIITKVTNTDPATEITTYYNSAAITWDGFPTGTVPSGQIGTPGVGVGVGFTSLTKSGVRLTPNIDRKIEWTVSFDPRGQTIDNLKIYDLIVYGSSFSCGSAAGFPAGVACSILTPRYGQQYVAGTFTPVSGVTGASINVIAITQGGNPIADLLEITIPNTGISEFKFQTQVLDPAIFAANTSVNAHNTATLVRFNTEGTAIRMADASASVPFDSSVLAKDMLHRDEAAKTYDAINSNHSTTNAAEGFNYQEKAVIFRLRVNSDSLNWPNILNGQGQPLGNVTVTDTLPAGWEFLPFSNGANYLVYEVSGGSGSGPVTVTGLTAAFGEAGGSKTATFTFTTLDKYYYILVKAKPNDATLENYLLSGTQPITRTNSVRLQVPGWDGVTASRNVSVNVRALTKAAIETPDHAIRWSITYNPFDLVKGNKLEDTLPVGIDLRVDSSGRLLLAGNITVNELTINSDGSFTEGASVSLSQDDPGKNIWYDNTTRTLHFAIPDVNKAYRLSYITDVTGQVSGQISNQAKLIRTDSGQVGDQAQFEVMDRHGQATMSRNGWLQILKRNAQGANLAGATFTLFARNTDTIIRVGTSGANGLIRIMGIPVGEYRLVETIPPSGYLPDDTVHTVRVVKLADETIVTSIDDRVGENTHEIALTNYRESDAVGRLRITKTVAGTDAETGKLFTFTLTISETSGEYTYVGSGGAPGGTLTGGTLSFALAHGQGITVIGLPAGTTYTVNENSYASDGYHTVSSGATGTIALDATLLADFTNTRNLPGELTITKRVEGDVFDPLKTFEFTVTFDTPVTPPVGGYAYTGNGVPDGFIQSGGTIALAHGQSITIHNLPEGTNYSVVERDYSSDGYVSQSAGATGTIGTEAGSTAAFTNRAPGRMTISKRLEGAGIDPARTFVFTVTFAAPVTPPAGGYPYVGNGVPNGTIRSGETIALAHNQSITITNLPVGTHYTVVENDYSSEGYITQGTGTTGTITNETSAVYTAAFTNQVPGRLTISKVVEGVTIDRNKKFEFTVNFTSPVAPPADGYPYTGNGVPNGRIRSGDKISLSHGQSIVITGLPVGTRFEVVEKNYISEGYVTESSGATGTISNGSTTGHTAAFTNLSSGSLTIRKTVRGSESDRSDRFNFTVTFPDLPSAMTFNFTGVGAKDGSFMNGGTISLSHGQSITILNIPAGTRYQVREKNYSSDGYTTTSVGASGTITAGGGVTADFTNTKGKVEDNPYTGDSNLTTRALFVLIYFALLLATLLGLDIYLVKRNSQRG